jgi:hypothetical protein
MSAFESKNFTLRLGQMLLLALPLGACGGKAVDLDRGADTTLVDDADVVVSAPAGTLWTAGKYLLWTDLKLRPDVLTPLQGCRKDDCTGTRVAYATVASQNVATSSTHVAFSHGDPWSCPLSGCEGHPTRVFDDHTLEVALDDDYLYWLSEDSVYRCPVDGCGALLPSVIASRQTGFAPIVLVAGGSAYWRVDSELRRTRVDGSEPVAVAATSLPSAGYRGDDLTIAGGSTLYYLGANNHLYECSLPTCTEPTDLVATDTEKFSLQADERGAFWLESDDTVHFCEASGCGSAPTAASPMGVYAFTIDAEYVYWSGKTKLSAGNGVPSPTGDVFSEGENIHRTARSPSQ